MRLETGSIMETRSYIKQEQQLVPGPSNPNPLSRPRNRLIGEHHLPLNHGFGEVKDSAPRLPVAKNVTGRNGCRHTKRSPSERRFRCEHNGCDKVFFTRKDVKRHMVVHTGRRDFACTYCQQRFGRKDHLVRHAKKSHNKDVRVSAPSFSGLAQPNPPNHHSFVPPKNHGSPFRSPVAHSSLAGQMSPMHGALLPHSSMMPSPTSSNTNHNGHGHHHFGQATHSTSSEQSLLLLGPSHGNPNGNGNSYPSCQGGSEQSHYSPTSSSISHHHHHLHDPRHGHVSSDSLVNSLTSGHAQSHVAQGIHSSIAKSPSEATPTPSYFTFPVHSASSFVGHTLMPNPFVTNSATRTFYSSAPPGAFSVNVHGMANSAAHFSVVCGDHVPTAAAHAAAAHAMAFPVENPQLPHFNQAFQ